MAYKNTYKKPMSKTTKIILWVLGIGAVAGAIIFIPFKAGKSLYQRWKEKKAVTQ